MKKLSLIIILFLSIFFISFKSVKVNASNFYQGRSTSYLTLNTDYAFGFIFTLNNTYASNGDTYNIFTYNFTDNVGTYSENGLVAVYDSQNDYYVITAQNNAFTSILYTNSLYMVTGDRSESTNYITLKFYRIDIVASNDAQNINYDIVYINKWASSFNISDLPNREVTWGITGIEKSNFYYGSTTIDALQTSVNNLMSQNYELLLQQGYSVGWQMGSSAGYSAGYNDGQAGENAISPIWNLFQGIFGTIGAIFSIELAPHVYIGYFFLVPLFFGVVGLILWIWRRN